MREDLLALILRFSAQTPALWREWSCERAFEFLRARLKFSQAAVGRRAGLTQAQVSRLEGGEDALLSTWRRAYAAMGFELLLVPICAQTAEELDAALLRERPENYWRVQHARPRRRWLRAQAERAAKEKGPERKAPGPSTDESNA